VVADDGVLGRLSAVCLAETGVRAGRAELGVRGVGRGERVSRNRAVCGRGDVGDSASLGVIAIGVGG